MVGEVLADRYELEELVGTGGMSSVYRAHDRLLDRKVALKILHQQYSFDEEYVERFRREARAVATLSHPNIVTVIDRGEHGGRQFIVFEYVDGENLKRLIERRGPAPVATALELAIQIAGGLSFAHQQGLVHRDVKPQNVLLNGDLSAKVTDFGIARSMNVQHGMTQTGTVLGTSDYIAPEQAQGQPVDEQTDVYSLGVVLYELLTSEVPFPGENFVAVAMRHINEEPPSVREKRPDVSPRLDAAIRCAMAKRPADRFSTMQAFAAELQACLGETQAAGTQVVAPVTGTQQVTQIRHRRRSMSPWPVIVAVVALIAIAVVVAVLILTGIPSSVPFAKSHGSGGTPPASGVKVPLAAIDAYDPFGSPRGQEHNDQASLATDGKAATAWHTENYTSTFAAIGKPGVGLILDAHQPVQLRQLGIATGTPGFTAEIKAGSSPTGPFDAVVGASRTVDDGTVFQIAHGVKYRYYLIWITALAPPGTGIAQINEVRAN
jgi:eukaryotic-like serine/threonine-protein kinase